MEHWITSKRDELIASSVQDNVKPSSPAPPSPSPVPRGSPGTLAAEPPESVLCSRDSEDEEVEEAVVASKAAEAVMEAVPSVSKSQPKTPVGAGRGRPVTSTAADGVDETEYFI